MDIASLLALAGQGAAQGTAGGAAQGQGTSGSPFTSMILMFAIIFMIFYFLIQRPQNREKRQQEEMRNSVKKGDKVVSIGGIHGTVTAVDTTNNIISVQVDRNVKIDFSKAAISSVIRKEDAREAEEPRKAEKS